MNRSRGTFLNIGWTNILFAAFLVTLVYGTTPVSADPGGSKVSAPAVQRVDINRATSEDFLVVKGIGPVIAARIVEFRKANGAFRSIDDLLKVRGIGEKLIDKIRDQLTVSKPKR